jgi:hypothetical protein
MGSTFGGSNFVQPPGVTTTILPAPASTQISIGDFLYWNGTNVVPFSAATGSGTAAIDQSTISDAFAGVAQQARITAQAVAGGYPGNPINGIIVGTDVVYEANCASATFECGDLVGALSSGAAAVGAISDQSVVAVAQENLAIGYVIQKYSSATTRVRVRLLGKNSGVSRANPNARSIGDSQVVGPGTLAAGADTTLTVASASIQVGVPTATRIVTLPAVASSKGLVFYIVNNAAATHAFTVKNAGATTIGSVAATKTGIFFCDGSAWYATIGS